MSLINPKLILLVAIAIAILLIAQAGAQTATQIAPMSGSPFSPFRNANPGNVDQSICGKIQQILGQKDPCRWSLDDVSGIMKLMVGERIVASARYTKMSLSELDQMIQTAIQTKLPQFVNKDFWTGYVEVDTPFQNIGVGTYVLRSGESMLRSGLVRIILDVDNWMEYNKSIPGGAFNVLPQIFVYMK